MDKKEKDVEINTDIEMGGKVLRLGVFDKYFEEAYTEYFESGFSPNIIVAIHGTVRQCLTEAIHSHDDQDVVFPWGVYRVRRTKKGLFVHFSIDDVVAEAIKEVIETGESECTMERVVSDNIITIFNKEINKYLFREENNGRVTIYCEYHDATRAADEIDWMLNSYAYAYVMSIIDTREKYDMTEHTGDNAIVIYGNNGRHAIVKLDGEQIIDLI